MQRTNFEREAGRLFRAMLGELASRAGDRDRSTHGLARRTAVAAFFAGDIGGARMLWRAGSNPGATFVQPAADAGVPDGVTPFGLIDGKLKAPLSAIAGLPQGSLRLAIASFDANGLRTGLESVISRACALLADGSIRFMAFKPGDGRQPPEFHLLVASSDPKGLFSVLPAPLRLEALPWPEVPRDPAARIAMHAPANHRTGDEASSARIFSPDKIPRAAPPEAPSQDEASPEVVSQESSQEELYPEIADEILSLPPEATDRIPVQGEPEVAAPAVTETFPADARPSFEEDMAELLAGLAFEGDGILPVQAQDRAPATRTETISPPAGG
ncbi:MAG: hypothetical protein NT080_00845 [Spirochaetes bacterium]|nr:hypothetical protein [Spirochaetota bacterium]